MVTFDFINGEDFRLSLEEDYRELNLAMQNQAWKAAHVLAGSIIEAILVDYLVALGQKKRLSSDPLRMSLSDAISECRKENIISERVEHLSQVIRSYRNLIHPGRAIRAKETATENGAKIVHTLVAMIVEEITERKKQNYGFTAEQIITKLENDSTAIAIIEELLMETNEAEKERLLLEVIPRKYHEAFSETKKDSDFLSSLITCFRSSFENISDDIKQKVTKHFVKTLKEEKSGVVWRYAFFRGHDIHYLSSEDASLVKKHFLSVLKTPAPEELFKAMSGIGNFLNTEEAFYLLYFFINTLTLYEWYYSDVYTTQDIIRFLTLECFKTEQVVLEEIEKKLKQEYLDDIKNGKDTFAKSEANIYKNIFGIDIEDTIKLGDILSDLEEDKEGHPF